MNHILNDHQQTILDRLMEGNRRFAEGRAQHPAQTIPHREQLVAAQYPVATVLGCADSRVPPELVFDQGLGDLFVIRIAANILTPHVIGTLEFAAAEVRTPLIIVLGHTLCGAIMASLSGMPLPGHLPQIAAELEPSMQAARAQEEDIVTYTVKHNALRVAAELPHHSPLIAQVIEQGQCAIVAAYYDMATGHVHLLDT